MQILRRAHEVSAYLTTGQNSAVQSLINIRMDELVGDAGTAIEEVVFFVILDDQDDRRCLEMVLGTALVIPDGFPLWEVIEEHDACYELVFVLSSDGSGAIVFALKDSCHPEILSLCQKYAYRGPPHPPHVDAEPNETAHRGGFFMPAKPEEPNEAS